MHDLKKKASTKVKDWQEIIETQHQETLNDERYNFKIDEMRKLVLSKRIWWTCHWRGLTYSFLHLYLEHQ